MWVTPNKWDISVELLRMTHTSYTSSEAATATETFFIVSFDVTCKNEGAVKPNL